MAVIRAGRLAKFGLAAVSLSVGLVVVSAVIFTRGSSPPVTPSGRGPVDASAIATTGDMTSTIDILQQRLERLPSDYASWAALGAAYVQQARITGDPSYYAKASGVLQRSLQESPGNADALTGMAALAAARHDFATAYRQAEKSLRVNAYSSATMAVQVDALIERGSYDHAQRALQRYVNLKPGVPSYTRVSYNYELRGNLEGARFAMNQALKVAYSSDDKAFALFELGELAWNAGQFTKAEKLYEQGRSADPDYVANLYGLAKVTAALGHRDRAVRLYQHVVNRLPQPSYVIEYADLLTSMGRTEQAAAQRQLVRAQQRLFRAAGVDLDLELALYDASHGRPQLALMQARRAFHDRQSIFVEDALAWALHVNGRDAQAKRHVVHAQRLGTRSALFAFHRGMIERSLGNREQAARWLHSALEINPAFNPIFAQRAHQVLRTAGKGR